MNKTTIALLTAAALGTSGLAAAQTDGPNFSGRIDIEFRDVDGTATDGVNGVNRSSKLAVSGGSDDAVAGLSTFYYARVALRENGNGNGNTTDYAYTGFEGDFGRLSFGVDDDIVYKYVGAYTDVYRGIGPSTDAVYSTGYGFGQEPSVQYSIDTDGFSAAAYVDTGVNGIDRTQLAGSVDFGAASVGAAFADSDAGDSEVALGGSVDVGMASLRATYFDRANDTKPVHFAAVAPLNDVFTATVGYGMLDNAADDDEINAMLMANLGGGLDLTLSARGSDAAGDAVSVGGRYSF